MGVGGGSGEREVESLLSNQASKRGRRGGLRSLSLAVAAVALLGVASHIAIAAREWHSMAAAPELLEVGDAWQGLHHDARGGAQSWLVESMLYSEPNEPVSISTSEVQGSCEELGHRKMEYLDRQNVHCPANSALTSFRFERCSGNHFKYVASCGSSSKLISSDSQYHETSCQEVDWNNMEYLDRQNVQCPAGEVLAHFHLTRHGCGWRHMKFQFWCRTAELAHWHDVDSSCQALRGRSGEYLDRQRPNCAAEEVMTGFQLHAGGCGGDDMRFRVRCARVLMPWYMWGTERQAEYQRSKSEWYGEYNKEVAKYNKLEYPKSPTGDRLIRTYTYDYQMYHHFKKLYEGITYRREAIKAKRQWHTYERDPREEHKARHYKSLYEHYHNLYMANQGTLPVKPVEHYPVGPPKEPNYKDPNYWNSMWTNKRTKAVKPVVVDQHSHAPCSAGKKCESNARAFFTNASSALGELLPKDPSWSKFPKALVQDPNTDKAKFDEAMATSTFDPLDNADFGLGLTTERRVEANHHMFSRTGCSLGDKECLKKAGAWPGDGTGEPVLQGVNDTSSAVAIMRRVDEHLDGVLPADPAWGDYPKDLVEVKGSSGAQLRDGMAVMTFDPLENADIGMVPGDHDRSRMQYRTDVREATGCDMGEVDCFEKFKKDNYPKFPKVKSDDCFGEHGCSRSARGHSATV